MNIEDIEIVIKKTGVHRFRQLCDENHADYEPSYVPIVTDMASHFRAGGTYHEWIQKKAEQSRNEVKTVEESRKLERPSVGRMAASAVGAVARVATALVNGQRIVATREEQARRLAICRGTETTAKCGYYDPASDRCMTAGGCGCFSGFKAMLETEAKACPLGKW